jgi:hypothetical protein
VSQRYRALPDSQATVSDVELDELAERFQRDGYVVVPGAVSTEDARHFRDAILGLIPSDLSLPARWLSSYGRIKPLHSDGDQTYDIPQLLPSWQNEPLYRLVRRLLGSGRLRVFDGSLAITLRHDPGRRPLWQEDDAGTGRVHIDTGVPRDRDDFRLDERELEVGGCYYFTDVAPGGGGICVIPGGHRWVAERASAAPGGRHLYRDWTEITDTPPLVEVVGKAGDFVLLHHLMPHTISHNRSATTRVAQFLRWVREDNPYGIAGPVDPGQYAAPQRAVLTELGRRLLGIDPWPAGDG